MLQQPRWESSYYEHWIPTEWNATVCGETRVITERPDSRLDALCSVENKRGCYLDIEIPKPKFSNKIFLLDVRACWSRGEDVFSRVARACGRIWIFSVRSVWILRCVEPFHFDCIYPRFWADTFIAENDDANCSIRLPRWKSVMFVAKMAYIERI